MININSSANFTKGFCGSSNTGWVKLLSIPYGFNGKVDQIIKDLRIDPAARATNGGIKFSAFADRIEAIGLRAVPAYKSRQYSAFNLRKIEA